MRAVYSGKTAPVHKTNPNKQLLRIPCDQKRQKSDLSPLNKDILDLIAEIIVIDTIRKVKAANDTE